MTKYGIGESVVERHSLVSLNINVSSHGYPFRVNRYWQAYLLFNACIIHTP